MIALEPRLSSIQGMFHLPDVQGWVGGGMSGRGGEVGRAVA